MYSCSKKIACAEQFFKDTFLRFIYPPASEASKDLAHLTERKNPHTPVYDVKEFVSLSVSSLHWSFSCFLCCFCTTGVYSEYTSSFLLRHRYFWLNYPGLHHWQVWYEICHTNKLCVSDIIVSQKRRNKVSELTITLWALENVCQRKYTPLYEKGIKQDQNKQMETTLFENFFLFPEFWTMMTPKNCKNFSWKNNSRKHIVNMSRNQKIFHTKKTAIRWERYNSKKLTNESQAQI